jgi:ATP-dependent RNA helicase DeaD
VQVAAAFKSYAKHRGNLNIVAIYGGQPIERQFRSLSNGAHVVVATPGRLIDHINRGTISLTNVKVIVLDEADEMLAMGFIEDVERILAVLPKPHQTALYSATMPEAISNLAKRYMTNPAGLPLQPVSAPPIWSSNVSTKSIPTIASKCCHGCYNSKNRARR